MQIKTFKKSAEKEINEFINTVAVLNGGITVTEDDITIMYREDKYLNYGDAIKLEALYGELFKLEKDLFEKHIDLLYFDKKELHEQTGVLRREKQEKIKATEVQIEVIKEEIKELE